MSVVKAALMQLYLKTTKLLIQLVLVNGTSQNHLICGMLSLITLANLFRRKIPFAYTRQIPSSTNSEMVELYPEKFGQAQYPKDLGTALGMKLKSLIKHLKYSALY